MKALCRPLRRIALSMASIFAIVSTVNICRADPPKYPVCLSWPVHVGDQFDLSLAGSRTKTVLTRRDGGAPEIALADFAVIAEGRCVVRELNESREIKKLSFAIVRLQRDDALLCQAGTVVEMDLSPSLPTYTINGKPAGATLTEALDFVAMASHGMASGGENGDVLFGTKDSVAVGSSWPVNRDSISRILEKSGIETSPSDIAGTVQLIDDRNWEGVPALTLRLKIYADKIVGGSSTNRHIDDGKLAVKEEIKSTRNGIPRPLFHSRESHFAIMVHGIDAQKHPYTSDVTWGEAMSAAYRNFAR